MAWLSSWNHRKTVTITGQSGAGTDYQVNLSIGDASGGDFHLENHCTSFPNDITVTDNDQTTLLDHWVEDLTVDPISMWVEIADTLDSNADVCVYYDKTGESSASNGDNTFPDTFDHFLGDALGAKWSHILNNGTTTVSGSIVYLAGATGLWNGWIASNISKITIPFVVEWYAKFAESASHHDEHVGVNDHTQGHWSCDSVSTGASGTPGKEYRTCNGGTCSVQARTTTLTSYTKLKMIVESGSVKYYENDILKHTETSNVPDATLGAWMGVAQTVGELWADWVFIRDFHDPEPAFSSAGSEENAPVAGVGACSQILNPWGINKYGAVIG